MATALNMVTMLTLVSALATVVAVVQTYRANRLNKRIAEAQHALAKPNIRVAYYDETGITAILVAVPIHPNRIVEFPMRWTFTNIGDKTAREVEIFIRSPRELWYGGGGIINFTSQEQMSKISARSVSTTEHIETQIVTANTLHPGQAYILSGGISLHHSTFLHDTMSVEAADGPVSLTYEVDFLYTFNVIVAQADRPVATSLFTLGVIDTSSQSAATFLNEYNKKLANKESGSKRRSGKVVGKFRLIEVRSAQLVSDHELPIDRLKEGESVSVCEGIRFSDGYFVPAIGVTMGIPVPRGT